MSQTTVIETKTIPRGEPGDMVAWTFTADGIDGSIKAKVDVSYPNGETRATELAPFSTGTQTVFIKIGPSSSNIASAIKGQIVLKIKEGGDAEEYGPFPIAIGPHAAQFPSAEIDWESVEQSLHDLWSLSSAFLQNGDQANCTYIREEVDTIKLALGMP